MAMGDVHGIISEVFEKHTGSPIDLLDADSGVILTGCGLLHLLLDIFSEGVKWERINKRQLILALTRQSVSASLN